jgi:FkbM family methyltransferase
MNNNVIAEINNYRLQLMDIINGIYQINEIFLRKTYNGFVYNRKSVIDIGGFIGDTALYFIMNGAKNVKVYEINKQTFDVLQENVRLNNLQNKISVYNMGISNDSKTMVLNITEKKGSTSLDESFGENIGIIEKRKIKLTPIKEILIEPVDILKIDCEGCEYEILESIFENNLIDKINEGIVLESHDLNAKKNSIYMRNLLNNIGFKKIEIIPESSTRNIIYARK